MDRQPNSISAKANTTKVKTSVKSLKQPAEPFLIYYAGDLWDHKHLIGNAILAGHIDRASKGRYKCVVPQNLEQATERAVQIRDQDLAQVMRCDIALFNFDGVELDSGTVVEYMFAKMLDIPTLIIRSDFRSSGDGNKDGDDWNLMVSSYPRTAILKWNAMQWYQEAQRAGGTVPQITARLYKKIAAEVINNLDLVRSVSPSSNYNQAELELLFMHALGFPGGGLRELFSRQVLKDLIARKQRLGLLAAAPA